MEAENQLRRFMLLGQSKRMVYELRLFGSDGERFFRMPRTLMGERLALLCFALTQGFEEQ